MTLAKNGITAETLNNIFKSPGVIYKNLTFTPGQSGSAGSWAGTVLGATQGGNSIEITPELTQIEIDGCLVPVKGTDSLDKVTCKIKTKLVEITKEGLKLATLAKTGTSEDSKFDLLELKDTIVDADYLDNVACVFFSTQDKPIIFIMENAICTSGIKFEGKQKDPTVAELEFEPRAESVTDATTLPVKIYVANDTYAA